MSVNPVDLSLLQRILFLMKILTFDEIWWNLINSYGKIILLETLCPEMQKKLK